MCDLITRRCTFPFAKRARQRHYLAASTRDFDVVGGTGLAAKGVYRSPVYVRMLMYARARARVHQACLRARERITTNKSHEHLVRSWYIQLSSFFMSTNDIFLVPIVLMVLQYISH